MLWLPLLCCALALSSATVEAADWSGGGSNMNWSTDGPGGNWSGGAAPGTTDSAVFTDAASAASGVLTNVVDTSYAIGSLSYQFGATPQTFYHTTEIAAGQTLLASDGLYVAPENAANYYTIGATIQGADATLQVGQNGASVANIVVARAPASTGSHIDADLDLRGLGNFTANLDTLFVGDGTEWAHRATGTLYLAPQSQIAAQTVQLGDHVGTGILYLGEHTEIRADAFFVGHGKGGGSVVQFDAGAPNPTLMLRGRNGQTTDLTVGHNPRYGTGANILDTMDLSAGTTFAELGTLSIGDHQAGNTGSSSGTLTMGRGEITAQTLKMGHSNSSNPGNTIGTLIIDGTTADGVIVLGEVLTGTGQSHVEVRNGFFRPAHTFDVDTLDVDAGGSLHIRGLAASAGSQQVRDTFDLAANGQLVLWLNGQGVGTIQADTATLASGAELVITPGLDSTEPWIQTRWIAGTGAWDTEQADWDHGLPGGTTIHNGDSFTFLQADTLTDNGLVLATSDWSLSVTPGASGSASVTRTGADLTTGTVRAVIDDPTADVSRASDLRIANEAGADAAMLDMRDGSLTIGSAGTPQDLLLGTATTAGELRQSGGTITVHGDVVGGGRGYVNLYGGTLNADGNFQVDALNLGDSGGTALLHLTGSGATHTIGDDVTMAPGGGSATLRLQGGGALDIGGSLTAGVGTGSLHVDDGSVDIQGDLVVDDLRVGYEQGNGALTVHGTGSTVTVGRDGTTNLYVGVTNQNLTEDVTGMLDLSAAAQFTARLDQFIVGQRNDGLQDYNGDAIGTVELAAANDIQANRWIISDQQMWLAADESTVRLGTSNLVKTDELIVAYDRGNALMEFRSGGTLTLEGLATAKADLRIGFNDLHTGNSAEGTLDLSGGTFSGTLGTVEIGYHNGKVYGTGQGTLIFDAGQVSADEVILGHAEPGDNKNGTGIGDLVMRGGTMTVGGDVKLGVGTATSHGTLKIVGGTMTVQGDILWDVGTADLRIDGGKLDYQGHIAVDNLYVGHHDGQVAGNLSAQYAAAAGTTVQVGRDSKQGNLHVGLNDTDKDVDVAGTLDLSNAASFTARLEVLSIGHRAQVKGDNDNQTCLAEGTLTLAPINDIDSVSILVSETEMWSANVPQSALLLGAQNTIRTDTLTVAGLRGNGLMKFADGVTDGVLDLSGSTGDKADLQVGYCWKSTSSPTNALVDLVGGTFNAELDELVIGYRQYRPEVAGTTVGELRYDAGTVTANSVVVGDGRISPDDVEGIGLGTLQIGGTAQLEADTIVLGNGTTVSEGTIDFSGGTITANSIDDGVGTAVFDWIGGTLHVGTFGFDLVQNGGTLAPGNSVGTTLVEGDYTLNAGELSLELNGSAGAGAAGGHDQLAVQGDVHLLGGGLELLLGFDPATTGGLGSFLLVDNRGSNPIDGTFVGLEQGSVIELAYGGQTYEAILNYRGGDGNDIVLGAVPEPSGLLLLCLGAIACLIGTRSRRR